MTVLVATVVGFLAGRLMWLLLRPVLSAAIFLRANYRGVEVPVGAGIVVAVAAGAVAGVRTVLWGFGAGGPPSDAAGAAVLVLTFGLCLLGLFDDLGARGDDRGFAGHVRALVHGRLTTGGLKLVGGGALALAAAGLVAATSDVAPGVQLLVDGALIALGANAGNLFDRAPGRALKVGGVAFGALVVATAANEQLASVALVIGAALALALDDLHERLMLGDAGANVVGGVLALGVVTTTSPTSRLVTLAALTLLNLASEVVSFSRVIERVPPLRAIDRAGRLP